MEAATELQSIIVPLGFVFFVINWAFFSKIDKETKLNGESNLFCLALYVNEVAMWPVFIKFLACGYDGRTMTVPNYAMRGKKGP